MLAQDAYKPEFEDWLCHAALPLIAYAVLALSALADPWYERNALFGIGASALLLLFIGIHNAWDTVTYHVYVRNLGDLPVQTDDADAPDASDTSEQN
jgi:hypothetical protein